MKLAFYSVINSQNFERHTFDGMKTDAIKEKLSLLSDEELTIYDMDDKYDVNCFEYDYND